MEFRILVPPEHAAGTYANLLTTWYGEHEFTLDFSVMLPPMQTDDDSPPVVVCPVLSRLKVPVTVLFEMLQAINGTMNRVRGSVRSNQARWRRKPMIKSVTVAKTGERWIFPPRLPAGTRYAPLQLVGDRYTVVPIPPAKR